MVERTLAVSITGEPYQPVRLHYRVLERPAVLGAFDRLRCVEHVPKQGRWVWLYDHEAKDLRFKTSYAEIPEKLRPVVLGSFFLRENDELLLDLTSCDRAILAIPFFDEHLPRTIAKLTDAEVVNRLFSTNDPALTPDRLFDESASNVVDPAVLLKKITDLTAGIRDPAKRLEVALREMDAQSSQALTQIERMPVHFYEDGIDGFALSLKARQIVAMEHWLGNTGYRLTDAIKACTKPA